MGDKEFVGPLLIHFGMSAPYDTRAAILYASDAWVDARDPLDLLLEIYESEHIGGVAIFGQLVLCGDDTYFLCARATPFMVVTSEITAVQPFKGTLKGGQKLMKTVKDLLVGSAFGLPS